jgi:hypothetical protein
MKSTIPLVPLQKTVQAYDRDFLLGKTKCMKKGQ